MSVWYYLSMKTISLKLPEAIEARLAARASATGKSKSELTREALTRLLDAGAADGAGVSCFDMVRDLVGTADGPTDLASNKKHLRGYGR